MSAVRCEYLVVGSGAGGSVAARELARAGKDVLVLEEGEAADPREFTGGIGAMMRRLYRNGGISPIWGHPPVGFAEACCLGGGTLINGGLVWRTPDWILEEWERRGLTGYGSRHLRPHFETIERLLHVSLPVPSPGLNRDSEVLVEASRALGWKCVPAPRALRGCQNRNLCTTGCPTGAKQSTVSTYLAEARSAGARILAGTRVSRLWPGTPLVAQARGPAGPLEVRADRVFLAAGPIHSPTLLRRSGLSREAGRRFEFHLNLKVVATFEAELKAGLGTMFTDQVQEFERQGVLLMASNLQAQFVTSTLAHHPPELIRQVLADLDRCGLYVAIVRAVGQGRVHPFLPGQPLMTHSLTPADLDRLRLAYVKMAELLFAAGADTLYPPIRGAQPARSLAEAQAQCQAVQLADLELISVHAMSSCHMGLRARDSVVDPEGRLWANPRVTLCDASVLPSNLGESPQGTIMAVAHEILRRHLA